MRYIDFRDAIQSELQKNADGLTWAQLKECLDLPYDRPCPTWIRQMEGEIGLSRLKKSGRALVWFVQPD